MYPHRIRLRGPWELFRLSASGAPTGSSERVNLPYNLDEPLCGPARLRRRFGLPRTIDNNESVWLTFQKLPGAFVSLNGTPLEAGSDCDVTAKLRERNELCVDFPFHGPIQLWEEAALEIRAECYLRHVRFRVRSTANGKYLEASGQVVGVSKSALDLYLICERSTIGYATIESRPEGREFAITSSVFAVETTMAHEVRVELVCGGVVYYEAAGETEF